MFNQEAKAMDSRAQDLTSECSMNADEDGCRVNDQSNVGPNSERSLDGDRCYFPPRVASAATLHQPRIINERSHQYEQMGVCGRIKETLK